MITVHKTDGTKQEFTDNSLLNLEWMQAQVGGLIQIVTGSDNSLIVCNEEGKLDNLPHNEAGTKWFDKQFGKNLDEIWGDCIIVTSPNFVD